MFTKLSRFFLFYVIICEYVNEWHMGVSGTCERVTYVRDWHVWTSDICERVARVNEWHLGVSEMCERVTYLNEQHVWEIGMCEWVTYGSEWHVWTSDTWEWVTCVKEWHMWVSGTWERVTFGSKWHVSVNTGKVFQFCIQMALADVFIVWWSLTVEIFPLRLSIFHMNHNLLLHQWSESFKHQEWFAAKILEGI